MLLIERAVVDALNRASSAQELADLMQEACRLEFSTISPYLTAMLSLEPGYNREISTSLSSPCSSTWMPSSASSGASSRSISRAIPGLDAICGPAHGGSGPRRR
jgi:hypothetical protein